MLDMARAFEDWYPQLLLGWSVRAAGVGTTSSSALGPSLDKGLSVGNVMTLSMQISPESPRGVRSDQLGVSWWRYADCEDVFPAGGDINIFFKCRDSTVGGASWDLHLPLQKRYFIGQREDHTDVEGT